MFWGHKDTRHAKIAYEDESEGYYTSVAKRAPRDDGRDEPARRLASGDNGRLRQ